MDKCLNCDAPLMHIEGRRKKVFCSDRCRVSHYRKKNKQETVVVPKEEYDELVAFYSSRGATADVAVNHSGEYVGSVDAFSKDYNESEIVVAKKYADTDRSLDARIWRSEQSQKNK